MLAFHPSQLFSKVIAFHRCQMAETGLVALAATLKELLASPQFLVPTSKAEHDARLDIIDMIPDLNRTLVGDKQTLRDLAWSVGRCLVALLYHYRSFLALPPNNALTGHVFDANELCEK